MEQTFPTLQPIHVLGVVTRMSQTSYVQSCQRMYAKP